MTPSTSHRLLESIRLAMEQSDLLNTLASVHAWAEEGVSLVQGVATRRLTEDEIGRLSVQGNRSDDWALVEVGPGFTTDHISGNRFLGRVVLGAFSGAPAEYDAGVTLPTGLYDSTLRDCEIGDEVLIHRVGLISGTLVAPHATVVQTDSLTGGTETLYGCDLALPPGVEAGGHGGSHGQLMSEFVEALLQERTPLVDIAQSLNMTVSGIVAHESALKDGELLKIPQYTL